MNSIFATSSHGPADVTGTVGTRESRRSEIRFTVLRGWMFAGACTLGTVAGSGVMLTNHVAKATDCDCWDAGCDSCGSGGAMKHNLLYKSLDSLAGGIERVLGLDKSAAGGCDEFGCDDGCDSGSMQELMLPMEPMHIQSAPHTYATPLHGHPPAATSDVPGPMYDSTPYVPTPHYVPERHYIPSPPPTESNVVEPPMTQTLPETEAIEVAPPESQAIPQPIPESQPNKDGSLFDSLGDPFGDDEARNYRPYRNVRPSGYLQRAGSVSGQQRNGTVVRPGTGMPARKATQRTATPTLNGPVRQTNAVRQTSSIDHQPIGSGVARTSGILRTSTMQHSPTQPSNHTPSSRQTKSSAIVELTPTDYLSSSRSASKYR